MLAALPDSLPPSLLADLLAVSLTGVNVLQPCYEAGTLTDFAILYLNPAAQRMTGLAAQPGGTLLSRFPTTIANGILTYYRRVYEAGDPTPYEVYYQADGLDNYFKLAARRSGDLLVVSFTDTADQDRTPVEQALRASQAREQAARAEAERQRAELQRVFAQSPIAMGRLRGPDLLIEMANVRMGYIWGRPVAQLLGRPHFEALPDLAGQGFEQVLAQVLATGQPYEQLEQPITIAHRELPYHGYLNITYLPEQDAHGQSTGILIYASDVTEQVRARQQVQLLNQELEARVQRRTEELAASNQELHQSNTRLLRTNTDLDTFVYTASHDLKAPITNIEGILAALRDTLPPQVQQDETVAHLLGLLDNTVGRFLTTISQLTDLSRLQQTYNEPAELLHLAPVVADVLADLAPQVAAAQAQVYLAVPAGLQVSFAPASLRSIIYNLLSNAVKYRSHERPAQVWLQAARQEGQVVLTVRDNGLGLTQTQQTRLFGVFQRLHTHVEGTGVGLYMIKCLIENAGATISVNSQPGEGSAFIVAFPA